MLMYLLPLLLISASADGPLVDRCPGAAEVFDCTFDSHWDRNYDGWPAGWTRQSGDGFPQFVGIKIEKSSPRGDACLRVDLDGGGAAAYSPPIKIDPLLSYVLDVSLKADGLKHDRACVSIALLDANHRKLHTYYSERFASTGGWKKLRIGPLAVDSAARLATVGLHVETGAQEEDLHGTVRFANVWLGCLPRLTLSSNQPLGLLTSSQTVEVTCTASGFLEPGAEAAIQLEDHLGRLLATVRRPLTAVPDGGLRDRKSGHVPSCWIGQATWRPPLVGPGFYVVRASVAGKEIAAGQCRLNLAVVAPQPTPAYSEFGWTLPRGDEPLSQSMLIDLLSQAGIHWVKYPLWCNAAAGGDSVARAVRLHDALDAEGMEMVGLLLNPPTPAAEVFAGGPKTWYPAVEPAMLRLAAQVRWWQLGADSDSSFVSSTNLPAKIAEVKATLDRIGQDVHVGMGWDWRQSLPGGPKCPWSFLALSARPPMTANELAAKLDVGGGATVARWVAIDALPKDGNATKARVADMAARMIAAKIHGAEGIFCPDPFDPQCGLMEQDGAPGELLLPWRTTALMIGGSKHVGTLDLPGGSPNAVFVRGKEAVVAIWNDDAREEAVYLGPSIRQVDLWGRAIAPATCKNGAVVRAGRVPSFLVGASEAVVRWQLGCTFAREQIPSIPDQPHANSLLLKNSFPDAVGVKAKLFAPDRWIVEPNELALRLPGGAESQQPFTVTLPPDVLVGRQEIRIEFEIQADRPHHFSIDRHIEVGMGDVGLSGVAQLNERGELEVRQTVVNRGKTPVSFRCQLFVPDRRREASQVIDLDRAADVKVYALANGRELLGKTLWLRAEEVGGDRVLNCRLEVR